MSAIREALVAAKEKVTANNRQMSKLRSVKPPSSFVSGEINHRLLQKVYYDEIDSVTVFTTHLHAGVVADILGVEDLLEKDNHSLFFG